MLVRLALVSLWVSSGLAVSSCTSGEAVIAVTVRQSEAAGAAFVQAEVDGEPLALVSVGGVQQAETVASAQAPATVACTVTDGRTSGGTVRARGSVRLDLRDGWRYGVTCAVQATDPATLCMGCRGSEAFPIDPALGVPADHRLWVTWSGDPLEDPPID